MLLVTFIHILSYRLYWPASCLRGESLKQYCTEEYWRLGNSWNVSVTFRRFFNKFAVIWLDLGCTKYCSVNVVMTLQDAKRQFDLISPALWVVTKCVVVTPSWCFGTTYHRSQLLRCGSLTTRIDICLPEDGTFASAGVWTHALIF